MRAGEGRLSACRAPFPSSSLPYPYPPSPPLPDPPGRCMARTLEPRDGRPVVASGLRWDCGGLPSGLLDGCARAARNGVLGPRDSPVDASLALVAVGGLRYYVCTI